MRLRQSGALLGAALLLAACSGGTGSAASAKLETDNQKASYGIGLDMGRNLKPAKDSLDMNALRRGLEDALADRDPAIPQDEIQKSLQAFSQAVMAAQQAEHAAQGEKNKTEGEAYLQENGAKDGVTTTESGLQYEVLRAGDGPKPSADDTVELHYKGTLIDGTVFDSSYDRNEPAEFAVSSLIPGFSEALQLMPVGSKYRVVIPSDLAYGPNGAGGDIGPNATLVFEIEVLGIK